jgi:hypothetical protein
MVVFEHCRHYADGDDRDDTREQHERRELRHHSARSKVSSFSATPSLLRPSFDPSPGIFIARGPSTFN